jgi:hypothetical protein
MNSQTDIETILVELLIDGTHSLFLLLSAEGLINRMGSGGLEPPDRQKMYIGKGTPDIFGSVCAMVTPSLLQCFGGKFEARDRKGQTCDLTLVIGLRDGKQLLTRWRYGSKSTGPHPEVRNFVAGALAATDAWFARQVEGARK